MFRNSLTTVLAASLVASFAVACGDDDDTNAGNGTGNGNGGTVNPCPGTLTAEDVVCSGGVCILAAGVWTGDLALTADNDYLLNGRVFIGDGTAACSGSLTIAAGTTVFGSSSERGYLAVKPNSTINAVGTADSPINFRSDASNPGRGDWGGLIISGNASVNCGGTGTTCNGEGDTGAYGGNNDEDNSGRLEYVIVQHGGNRVNPTDELNGIAFQGVGSQTVVENIRVNLSGDDGVEFFGGTVNAKWIILTGIGDDNIDWTFGWRGNLQFGIVQQYADASDNGIEADNNGDLNTATPRSNPILSNLTLVGSPLSTSSDTGMLLREGTGGQIWSSVVIGFEDSGLDIDNAETFTNASAAAGNLAVAHGVLCNWSNIKDDGADDGFPVADFFNMGDSFGSVNNEMATFPDCGLGYDRNALYRNTDSPNFTPTSTSVLMMGGATPSGDFFEAVTYRGAVEPGVATPWYAWAF